MKSFLGMLLGVVSFISAPVFAAEVITPVDYVYQVKKGDTLGGVSKELLATPSRWKEVATYNKLPNEHRIYPGETLHVPFALLKNVPAEGRIEAMVGNVFLNGQVAKIGDAVPSGAVVTTAKGGFARLSLPDGSLINVLESSRLDATKIEKKSQSNYFSSAFRLVAGRIDAIKKKYAEGQAPLLIHARNATIGVRGTHFRIGQEDGNTLAEIEHGLVGFETADAKQNLDLPGGFGSVADGVTPASVIPLLPAPHFPSLPAEFSRITVRIAMPALAGAIAYRGEIATDAEFNQIVSAVAAQGNVLKIKGLNDGQYWLRLRAVDKHGLQGLESATPIAIKVRPFTIKANAPEFESDKMLTHWQGEVGAKYEFQIAAKQDFSLPLVTLVTQETKLDLPRPDAGNYFLRLRPIDAEGEQGEWSDVVGFTAP